MYFLLAYLLLKITTLFNEDKSEEKVKTLFFF